jgi:hypothetical protein
MRYVLFAVFQWAYSARLIIIIAFSRWIAETGAYGECHILGMAILALGYMEIIEIDFWADEIKE